MLQGKCVFFAHFYGTLSCEKQFKDEFKKFLLIIVLNLIISFLDYAYKYEKKCHTGWGGVVIPSSRL